MAGLFGSKVKQSAPTAPVSQPDYDDISKKRSAQKKTTNRTNNRLVQTPGVLGREYSRGTLG